MIFFPFYWSHYKIYYTPCTFKWTHIFLARSLNASLLPETIWKEELSKVKHYKSRSLKNQDEDLKKVGSCKTGAFKNLIFETRLLSPSQTKIWKHIKTQTFEIVIPKHNARKSYTVYLFKRLTFVHVLPELQKKLK